MEWLEAGIEEAVRVAVEGKSVGEVRLFSAALNSFVQAC